MAKKDSRIFVGLVCTVCWKQNYVTSRNKMNTPKIELQKYCNHCKKHLPHKMKEKLK